MSRTCSSSEDDVRHDMPQPHEPRPSPKLPNRWIIALVGAWLQLFLGTVYAWSYFQKPLVDAYGWTNTQVAWAFSLAICFLGLAAAWGGTEAAQVRAAQAGRPSAASSSARAICWPPPRSTGDRSRCSTSATA